jgi:hypothetical protein
MSHTRYEPARQRLQRSELAVPGSSPALFVKALAGEADYVFLDLEDAVAPGDKEQARTNVIRGLLEHDWRGRGKTICVRINGIDTHYMYRDLVDVVEQAGHRLDTILIPKVGVPADVYLVDALLTQIEAAKGIEHRIGIDVLIETALGMANVEAIAQSSPRLEAMHFGAQPRLPGRPVARRALADDRGVPGVRAPADRRTVRRLQGPRRLPALRPAGRGARHRGEVGNPPIADRPGQRSVQPAGRRGGAGGPDPGRARRSGAGRARRGATRRQDDRRGVGADGAECRSDA